MNWKGLEVDEFKTYSELIDDGAVASLHGIVIDRDIWQLLGSQTTTHVIIDS